MDSQIEAILSFNYVFTIILNNVWTYMAILTAGAISFIWTSNKSSSPRIRQASSPSVSPQKPNDVHSTCSPQLSEPVSSNMVSTPALDCADGVIKTGKFVIYYYDDVVQEEDYRGNLVFGETDHDVPDGVKFCCRDLDMRWHRCLDLSVFGGNVVRLWD